MPSSKVITLKGEFQKNTFVTDEGVWELVNSLWGLKGTYYILGRVYPDGKIGVLNHIKAE